MVQSATFRVLHSEDRFRIFAGTWLAVACLAAALTAQPPDRAATDAQAARAAARLRALQSEADMLATQEKTLLVELRRLEIDRDIQTEKLKKIGTDLDDIARQIGDTTIRLTALEQQKASDQPMLESRLVELYKLGSVGYTRMLLGANNLQQFGRAYRMVAAVAALDRQRVAAHLRTIGALKAERGRLEERRASMARLQQEARLARAQLDRATKTRAALVAEIDARRDLNARLMGELQAAQQRLQQTLANVSSGVNVESVVLPLRAFQRELEWPAVGRITARFGRRAGPAVSPNGIQIAAAEGDPVRAVHEGIVAYAEPFTGFGNLIIVDHGAQAHSLYGYLSSVNVSRGARVDRGEALGSVGQPPTGAPALYFELRIDGKPVDPLEWLKRR